MGDEKMKKQKVICFIMLLMFYAVGFGVVLVDDDWMSEDYTDPRVCSIGSNVGVGYIHGLTGDFSLESSGHAYHYTKYQNTTGAYAILKESTSDAADKFNPLKTGYVFRLDIGLPFDGSDISRATFGVVGGGQWLAQFNFLDSTGTDACRIGYLYYDNGADIRGFNPDYFLGSYDIAGPTFNDGGYSKTVRMAIVCREVTAHDATVELWYQSDDVTTSPFSNKWFQIGKYTTDEFNTSSMVQSQLLLGWIIGQKMHILKWYVCDDFEFDPARTSEIFFVREAENVPLSYGELTDETPLILYGDFKSTTMASGFFIKGTAGDMNGDWSNPYTVFDGLGAYHYQGVGMVVDENTIGAFASRWTDSDMGADDYVSTLVLRASVDGGDTWGAEQELFEHRNLADGAATPPWSKGVRLEKGGTYVDGKWFLPFSDGSNTNLAVANSISGTWTIYESSLAGHEASVVQQSDGKIAVIVRNDPPEYPVHYVCSSATDFSSVNWDAGMLMNGLSGNKGRVPSVADPFYMLQNGNTWYMFTTGTQDMMAKGSVGRSVIDVWFSDDDGNTWAIHDRSPIIQTRGRFQQPAFVYDNGYLRGVIGAATGAILAYQQKNPLDPHDAYDWQPKIVEDCVNPPSMDTNQDCKVDFIDFSVFASEWMSSDTSENCANSPSMDTNQDCKVDFTDLCVFMSEWMISGRAEDCINPPSMDTNQDCKVDFIDFSVFASEWMSCGIADQSNCWK